MRCVSLSKLIFSVASGGLVACRPAEQGSCTAGAISDLARSNASIQGTGGFLQVSYYADPQALLNAAPSTPPQTNLCSAAIEFSRTGTQRFATVWTHESCLSETSGVAVVAKVYRDGGYFDVPLEFEATTRRTEAIKAAAGLPVGVREYLSGISAPILLSRQFRKAVLSKPEWKEWCIEETKFVVEPRGCIWFAQTRVHTMRVDPNTSAATFADIDMLIERDARRYTQWQESVPLLAKKLARWKELMLHVWQVNHEAGPADLLEPLYSCGTPEEVAEICANKAKFEEILRKYGLPNQRDVIAEAERANFKDATNGKNEIHRDYPLYVRGRIAADLREAKTLYREILSIMSAQKQRLTLHSNFIPGMKVEAGEVGFLGVSLSDSKSVLGNVTSEVSPTRIVMTADESKSPNMTLGFQSGSTIAIDGVAPFLALVTKTDESGGTAITPLPSPSPKSKSDANKNAPKPGGETRPASDTSSGEPKPRKVAQQCVG